MNMAATFAEDFARARPVARHCTELTWRGPRPEERAEVVAVWARDLASEMAAELGQILSGGKLEVSINGPDMMTGAQVFDKIGAVAANALLRVGAGDDTVLLSLDYATAIALTDCSFGGEGSPPDSVPSQLPRSAALLVEQFASGIAQVLALGRGTSEPVRGDVLVRSESVVRLKPFSAEADIAVFQMTMVMGAFAEWKMLFAIPSDRLDALLPKASSARSAGSSAESGGKKGDAYAGMPLSLEAVLTEFELPLSKLERLAPGDEIALTIPRELPLRIGEGVFAHGVPGTLDNHMALRLTSVPHKARDSTKSRGPLTTKAAADVLARAAANSKMHEAQR